MKEEWAECDGRGDGVEWRREAAPTFEEMMAARKLTLQDVREHISGPVLSIVVHVIVLAILSTVIVFQPPEEGKEIEVKEIIVDVKPFERKPPTLEPVPDKMEIDPDMNVDRPVEEPESETDVDTSDATFDTPSMDISAPNILSVKPTPSVLKMPALYGNRVGGSKGRAMREYTTGCRAKLDAVLKAI